MTIAILISVAGRNGFSPVGATLEINMVNIGAGVDDINIDTLTAMGLMDILVERAKVKRLVVGDTSETPRSTMFSGGWSPIFKSVNHRILLNIGNGRVFSDLLKDRVIEGARVSGKTPGAVIRVFQSS
jgi:hypothetical protein